MGGKYTWSVLMGSALLLSILILCLFINVSMADAGGCIVTFLFEYSDDHPVAYLF